jgi:hypothetical protein
MSITKLTTNGLTGSKYDTVSADNYYMEPIATTLLGTTASSVTFSSIPAGYKHLQIRGISRITSGSYAQVVYQLNGDTGSNYSRHYLFGDGASTGVAGTASTTNMFGGIMSGSSQTAGIFGALVTDILDYSNTSKNKTIRTLSGVDGNGSGYAWFSSGAYLSTSPITSVTIIPESSTFTANSRFSLFGVKG